MLIKNKAFTLIELLVVVAIIGILAAVGVVAYNGYTSSAKKNVTKANSDLIFKYVKTETFKCELDSSSGIMDFNGTSLLSCSDLAYPGASVAKVVQAIKKILDEKVKNSYDSSRSAINFGTSINSCYPSGTYNSKGQGEHHIGVGWENQKLTFFMETCIESSGKPTIIRKTIIGQ